MYGCPKWAPVNKEMDLLGSLKCLLKGGGRELYLGRGADGPSFPMVRLLLSSFYVFAVCLRPNATFSLVAYDLLEAVGIVIVDCIPSPAAKTTKRSVTAYY